MKFAHDFKETLASQVSDPPRRVGFPPHWVNQAIPYGQLKKCLKKVQRELQDLGLDSDTLRALLDRNNTSPVALQYKLKGMYYHPATISSCSSSAPAATDSNFVRPKLTVYVHMQDGVAVDASLTPTSRRFFERVAAEFPRDRVLQAPGSSNAHTDFDHPDKPCAELSATTASSCPGSRASYETIEVPLVFDSQFFDMLQSDVNNLDALQAEEEKKMTEEVVELGKDVSQVSRPSRFSKSDLARWRHIFELYLDAEVFFATHECDHGTRSSQKALKQLQWFQGEVDKRQLATDFKLRESRAAFLRFLNLNASLLKNLQFQELNKLAVVKILKSKLALLFTPVSESQSEVK
ncbi:RING finger protein [Tolypocladium capitatum]|uniref:RING finger protein n=1 Tax=Tolypocladium capitatum TaxID=45235 RepID=A0A2K3QPX2_9HYPO|nr:RING finger protein [Tolypocladium capitatum]